MRIWDQSLYSKVASLLFYSPIEHLMKQIVLFLLPLLAIIPAMAFAQEAGTDIPLDVEIEFTDAEGVVIGLGALAGVTTAYLRMRAARAKAIEAGQEWNFDATRFIDRVLMAVIASIPLALGSASNIIVLNAFTMVMIYLAALGSSELILELRNKNTTKKR